jgi:hypothetical protein
VTERAFQKRILEAFHAIPGAHAFKVSHMFLAGVPDLYIKTPNNPAFWLELKVGKSPLSKLQEIFIQREQKAGGYAGWAVLTAGSRVIVGRTPQVDQSLAGCLLGDALLVRYITKEICYGAASARA